MQRRTRDRTMLVKPGPQLLEPGLGVVEGRLPAPVSDQEGDVQAQLADVDPEHVHASSCSCLFTAESRLASTILVIRLSRLAGAPDTVRPEAADAVGPPIFGTDTGVRGLNRNTTACPHSGHYGDENHLQGPEPGLVGTSMYYTTC